jgi:hypothetical protein
MTLEETENIATAYLVQPYLVLETPSAHVPVSLTVPAPSINFGRIGWDTYQTMQRVLRPHRRWLS